MVNTHSFYHNVTNGGIVTLLCERFWNEKLPNGNSKEIVLRIYVPFPSEKGFSCRIEIDQDSFTLHSIDSWSVLGIAMRFIKRSIAHREEDGFTYSWKSGDEAGSEML